MHEPMLDSEFQFMPEEWPPFNYESEFESDPESVPKSEPESMPVPCTSAHVPPYASAQAVT